MSPTTSSQTSYINNAEHEYLKNISLCCHQRSKIVTNIAAARFHRFNSHGPQQKTYLSFGTDLAHVIDLTESLIIGNENVDQNVQLE